MLQRFVDAAAVEAEIERVRSLSGAALRRRWQAEFGRPAPKSLPGDLVAADDRQQDLGTGVRDARPRHPQTAGRPRPPRRRPQGRRNLKIGPVLVRDYQGRRHTVTVAPEGYVLGGWKRSGAMLGTFAIVVMMPLLLS